MKTILFFLFAFCAAFGAYDGNGSSEYMLTTTTPVTGTAFSVSCWFKVPNVTTRYTLVSVADSGGDNDYFRLEAAGDVAGDPVRAAAVAGGTAGNAATSTSYSANVWNHACGTFTAATGRAVFLNGGGGGSNATNLTPASIDRIGIGVTARSTLVNHINGSIAEVAIWNTGISTTEISSLAAGFSPRLIRPQNLVFYAPLVRNITDQKGRTLTNTSMTQSAHPRIYYGLTLNLEGRRNYVASLFNPLQPLIK